MDAIFLSSSAKKSGSPCKQLKNISRRNITTGANFVSKSSENLAPTNIIHGGGLLFAPPPSLSFSYPPPTSLLNPYHQQLLPQQQQQPPLLPPPLPNKPLYSSLPSRTRSFSSSPSNVKNNRTKGQSLTPKRSKSKQLTGKVEEPNKVQLKPTEATKTQATVSKPFVMASANPLGPDPNAIPKVLTPSYLGTNNVAKDLDRFSCSVFTLSPPPSSLPLPSFSLRPKLTCNAESCGGNPGATDNLRRLLSLRGIN